MLLNSTYTHQTGGNTKTQKPRKGSEETQDDNGLLDRFRPSYDRLEIHLDQPEYQNIKDLEASNLMGHFTKTMRDRGFPWRLYAASPEGDGFKRGKKVSNLDAAKRLKAGQPLLLQPMRKLKLNLSPDSIGAAAAVGSASSLDVSGLAKAAAISKNGKVTAEGFGIARKYGEPVVIQNYAQLKLLHQMYNAGDKIETKSETAKAAHQLSYFTEGTISSEFPWRFYKEDDSNTALRVTKNLFKGALSGGAFGALALGLLGAGASMFTQDPKYLKYGLAIGAGLGAGVRGIEQARTSLKGIPINAVEALERILEDKPVVFQESTKRSGGIPILGKMSWFSDKWVGSEVNNPEDLNTLYYMQSQAELPKAAPPKKPEKKPAPQPNVTYIDNSVHYHVQDNSTAVKVEGGHPLPHQQLFFRG